MHFYTLIGESWKLMWQWPSDIELDLETRKSSMWCLEPLIMCLSSYSFAIKKSLSSFNEKVAHKTLQTKQSQWPILGCYPIGNMEFLPWILL